MCVACSAGVCDGLCRERRGSSGVLSPASGAGGTLETAVPEELQQLWYWLGFCVPGAALHPGGLLQWSWTVLQWELVTNAF